MKTEEYGNFEEKGDIFHNGGVKICFNVDQMFDLLENLIKREDFIFRGCPEAKYKIYNSAQRYYIGNELYKQVKAEDMNKHYTEFISNLIEECKNWNNSTVSNLLLNSGINGNNCIPYLSFMQHYGVPTPLIDFTYDPYVALFFAIDGETYKPSDVEIDNYFSLYYTFQSMGAFAGWQATFDEKFKNNALTYDELSYNEMQILTPKRAELGIINNTNIINQKGLFFYNNDPTLPLEENYLEFIQYLKKEMGEDKMKEFAITETLLNCINFHKSLIPYIKKKLDDLGITREYIYPDFYRMKDKALTSASIKALNTLVHVSDEKPFWEV
ncbi:FRG domain-containing protein [Spirosoma fluviale]|uniref:FRG domain-containing protein n=1 Tax=Spirosoma fluviale TaxID=1597977 RepID=A0A286GX90_9BACT|nr:FRG domain-containing protein [Spirosoma fluviale]SOD99786.1 FRG domain-containing protein [Spirosoma fluviale]